MKFYRRNNVVYVQMVIDGKVKRASTGVMASGRNFRAGRFVGPSYHLNKLIQQRAEQIKSGNKNNLAELFAKYVRMMQSGELKTKSGNKFTQNSIRLYSYLSDYIQTYDGDIKNFADYLWESGLSDRTIAEMINLTRGIIKYWNDRGDIVSDMPDRKIVRDKPIVVLPPDFVKKFLTTDMELFPELQLAWEISATILVTSLRISDAISLSPKDFTISDGKVFLNKSNKKTGAVSRMPIPQKIGDIYIRNLSSGCPYSMIPENSVVYSGIRKLFSMFSELDYDVSIVNNGKTETRKMHEWVTPHMLRKSSITTMIYSGVPDRHIKFASGHSANSLAYQKYVGHVEQLYHNDVEAYHKTIFGE